MSTTVYKIMPNSDVVLVLKTPTTRFAVWKKAKEVSFASDKITQQTNDVSGSEEDKLTEAITNASLQDLSGGDALNASGDDDDDERKADRFRASQDSDNDRIANEADSDESNHDTDATPTSSAPASECGDDPNTFRLAVFEEYSVELPNNAVDYLVSSEHLKLASPGFEDLVINANNLKGKGGVDGPYYFLLEECDEEALHILLNILHLKNRGVPRKVSLEMLAKHAVLVDRYQCFEAVEVFVAIWTEAALANNPVPSTYCRRLVLWLYIAWVFRLLQAFKNATATVIEFGFDGSLRTMGLPIPSVIPVSCFGRIFSMILTT
jgi:hypothetical protein